MLFVASNTYNNVDHAEYCYTFCNSTFYTRITSLSYVSCDVLRSTIWANPEFCPDSRLDFYRPGIAVEFQQLVALFAIHATSPGPFPFM